MDKLLDQIKLLTDEFLSEWNKNDSLVVKTVTQMAKLNLELTDNFFDLLQAGFPNAARIVARPVYERSVFLQYILHDRREISSRALLFYHSSRLRQYLWLKYILRDPKIFKKFEEETRLFQKQNQQNSLTVWIEQQIKSEKEAFNRIEQLVNYCDIQNFNRDERRKTWYRLDPAKFGGNLKISTLSDVSRYVLNDRQNYYYNLFYGIDSLFTHGYLINHVLDNSIDQIKVGLIKLCFGNLNHLTRFMQLSSSQQLQIKKINQRIQRLRINQSRLDLNQFKVDDDFSILMKQFQKQIQQNFNAYQYLAQHHQNHALHVLLRTINEQVVSWRWIHDNHPDERMQLFALTSQIQAISDLSRLSPVDSKEHEALIHLRNNKKTKYDSLAQKVMRERTIHKDRQKRQWFVLETDEAKVHSIHQIERHVLEAEGEFVYLYANGFLSVHVHGINLEMPYLRDQENVFLLGGVDDNRTCHRIVTKLWQAFQRKSGE